MSGGPYKIGSLARESGFAPALLRAWERRFNLLAPERGPGGQRLYADADLQVLRTVRDLLDAGRSIGEIARMGREALASRSTAEPADGSGRTDPAATREWHQRVMEAALDLDSRAVSAALDEATAALGPAQMIDDVMVPVALDVGARWQAGTCSVASEHLLTDECLHRLRRLLDAAQPDTPSAPTAVAACFPAEYHQLGLAILAWRLARRGVRVTYLGSSLPVADLAVACREVRPSIVILSVTRSAPFRLHYPAVRAGVADGTLAHPMWIGGQGVAQDATAPPGISLVAGPADDALNLIAGAIRLGRSAAGSSRRHPE